MGLYIRQSDDRSELQKRLATELQEKAKQRAGDTERPDGVADSNYMEETRQTTGLAWVWVLIIAFVIGLIIWLAVKG